MEEILDLALRRADSAEVIGVDSEQTSVEFKAGKLTSVETVGSRIEDFRVEDGIAEGQKAMDLIRQKDGTYAVELCGLDIYDPLTGETQHTWGSDVAAWFLDTDYDGISFSAL